VTGDDWRDSIFHRQPKWAESWYFGGELGMILQLGLSPNILVG